MTPEPHLSRSVLGAYVNQVDVDTETERHFGEIEMHVHMYRLPFLRFERCVRALEAQSRVRTEHAFRDGCCEWVGDYVGEDIVRVYDGVLLDISCSETEVMVCC